MQSKVHIVGAGTSGLIAARDIASAGIETRVYDQKKRLGYPPRASGIVSIRGLEALGVDYRQAATNTLYGANIHVGGSSMHIAARRPQAHVLDRERLNAACLGQAEGNGAVVSTGEKIGDRELEAMRKDGIVIGADGAVSTVARHFGMGSITKYTLTYKAEFEATPNDARAVDLFFDNSVAPKFFAWLCPNSKHVVEAGIGIGPGHGNSKAAFERFLRMKYVADALDGAKQLNGYASMIPMQTARRVADAKRRILLVGDAAGQVKPTTGGGIVFGGGAAMLAAKAVIRHIREGASLADYESAFRKEYGTDLRLHALVGALYSRLDAGKLEFVMNMMKALGAEGFLSAYGDMDRPSLILKRLFTRNAAE
jgi:flavin-dependent dehydrogenase